MSTPITLLTVIAIITLAGWQSTIASEHDYEEDFHISHLIGASSPTSIDENVMNAAYFSAMMLCDGSLESVLSAKQQVVAGMNYALLLEMDNKHQWEVIVYQDLDHAYHLISSKQLP